MAENTEGTTFTVTDRRGATKPPDQPTSAAAPRPEDTDPRAAGRPSAALDFSGFLISLAANAMLFLGEPTPDGRTGQVDLVRAQEMVDLLALLEGKTRGNLTPEESALLTNLLYTLRLRYVEKAR